MIFKTIYLFELICSLLTHVACGMHDSVQSNVTSIFFDDKKYVSKGSWLHLLYNEFNHHKPSYTQCKHVCVYYCVAHDPFFKLQLTAKGQRVMIVGYIHHALKITVTHSPIQVAQLSGSLGTKRMDFPESTSMAPQQSGSVTPKDQWKKDSYKNQTVSQGNSEGDYNSQLEESKVRDDQMII